jgi:hypothetical protein
MKRTVKGALVIALHLLCFKESVLAQDELPLEFIAAHASKLVQINQSQQYEYNNAIYEKFYHRWDETNRPSYVGLGFVAESEVPLSPKVNYYYSTYQVFDIKFVDSNMVHTVGIGKCYHSRDEYLNIRD